MPTALHWVRNSAEYRTAMLQTYRLAAERLEEAVQGLQPGTWAVTLDGDETVVNNSQYQKERAALGKGYDEASWQEWVRRRESPPLPGAVAFLQKARQLGGRIVIVTNRKQAICDATRETFEKYEIPNDAILCAPDQGSSEKEPRWEMIQNGTTPQGLPPLRIVMWVGDNIQDFPGLDQSLRTRPDADFADFGRTFILLPNPMYGSWEKNPAN